MSRWLLLAVVAIGCGATTPVPARDAPCALPAPAEVIAREGTALLERFELDAAAVWESPALPDDRGYLDYRAAIREAGADLRRPIADPPRPRDEAEAEMWRREHRNVARVYGGEVGRIRSIHCLEALLFARQHRRHDQLERPTELIASILARGDRLRVYVGAGAELFPPKTVYGFAQVEADIADGWSLLAVLHNHTIQKRGGKPALGEPVPSTSDVALLRALADKLGMREARVTNGVYTGVIKAAELEHLETR